MATNEDVKYTRPIASTKERWYVRECGVDIALLTEKLVRLMAFSIFR